MNNRRTEELKNRRTEKRKNGRTQERKNAFFSSSILQFFSQGFTLIEMMIVIVVIAILIGMLLPSFRGTQDEAAEQRARSELRTLATAIESYYLHNTNTLPTTLSALTSATPRIVSSIPDDPFRAGSNNYGYARDSNAVYYVVWSYGRDRAADITGMDTDGTMAGANDDDIFVTNGTGTF